MRIADVPPVVNESMRPPLVSVAEQEENHSLPRRLAGSQRHCRGVGYRAKLPGSSGHLFARAERENAG
jgi:hypothetical protein